MRAANANKDMMASYFSCMVDDAPTIWLDRIRPGSIDTWEQLCQAFVDNYQATFTRPGTSWDLEIVKHKTEETIRRYIDRFWENSNKIGECDQKEVIMAFHRGL